nr:polyphosphate kinase 2 [Ruficoccus amylovorans]
MRKSSPEKTSPSASTSKSKLTGKPGKTTARAPSSKARTSPLKPKKAARLLKPAKVETIAENVTADESASKVTPAPANVDTEREKILDRKSKKQLKKLLSKGKRSAYESLHEEIMDDLVEEIEHDLEDIFEEHIGVKAGLRPQVDPKARLSFRRFYFQELRRLQIELVQMQDWVVETGAKIAVIFEGRDAAGKGGVIKRITQRLNPRVCRVTALPAPSEREKSQWYFQRYVPHLPAGGEIVLFDRSWYNRSGVERVMNFCNEEQVEQFFHDVPMFEQMLVNSGVRLIKYWFSITDEEQEFRFQCRIHDPLKQWKLSPMDLQSRVRWEDYTKAKEETFERTSFPYAPWHVVEGNDKKRARLNCIHHLLDQIPYKPVERDEIKLPKRVHHEDYHRHPVPTQMKVPEYYE